jgi:tetraacyldisaccharide 4'-kinase
VGARVTASPNPIALGASLLFGATVAMRRKVYAAGLVRPARVPCPVISVGNLEVGGTGKTPFVLLLLAKLRARGIRGAVVSRGYGARTSRREPTAVDPDGRAEDFGDEPILIARKSGVSVVVCVDRRRGAELAIGKLGAQAIVLDDGFQHWRLARDLDLVMLDARAPFGNGRLLPAGTLREPRSALERAQLLVLNHGPSEPGPIALPSDLAGRPSVEVRVRAEALREADGATEPIAWLRDRRVALLAGIAHGDRFEATVRALGARVEQTDFLRDHQPIREHLLSEVSSRARAGGVERILITEKDAARIGRLPKNDPALMVVSIEHQIVAGEAALDTALDLALTGEKA